jgi:hypothetical protein
MITYLNIKESILNNDSIIVDNNSEILQFYENIGIENKPNSLLVDKTSYTYSIKK